MLILHAFRKHLFVGPLNTLLITRGPRLLKKLLTGVLLCLSMAAQAREIPLEVFALRDVINHVRLSPDGKKLSSMKIPNRDANPIIEIYDTRNLTAKPFVIDANPMEITNQYWAANDKLIFTLRQKVRDKIEGFNQGVYETKIAILNVKKKKFKTFDEKNLMVEGLLPDKPNKILVSYTQGDNNGPGAKLEQGFRPRAYFEFDLERGTKKLLVRGKLALGNIEFDRDGQPWLARGFEIKSGDYIWYFRGKKDKKWREIYRLSDASFDSFVVNGPDSSVPGNILVTANNGNNTAGLWSFNTQTKKFDELIYRRKDVDVAGVRYHSNRWANTDEITAVYYAKDTFHYKYFSGSEEALYKQLQGLIPEASHIQIRDRSKDGKDLVVFNRGPKDPGTFYLIKNGKISVVGSRSPLIKPEDLANVDYITYTSRDGKTIAAFITTPKGKPPFPLVVMPHGGPFVSETVVYDEWAQLLANRGYLVLQPQYRGSLGYGQAFYQSAFTSGGQGGYKMQDDKDDGALHLVKKGLAAPNRVAMFGWSYGGYAALVAASRKDQIYQCVIAGAAVSDPTMQVNYYRYRMQGAQAQEQLKMWGDSVSPLTQVQKVNIPVLLIHGDVDQRVPLAHANKYKKLLAKHGKKFDFLELKGADHFSNTLFYQHQYALYKKMLSFLKQDCGEGGL